MINDQAPPAPKRCACGRLFVLTTINHDTCPRCRLHKHAFEEAQQGPLGLANVLTCGHCFMPMWNEGGRLRCSAKCKKAGRKDVRQWRTREGYVLNIRHMEESHLHAALRYLERNKRTSGNGYAWLEEERKRRGLIDFKAPQGFTVPPGVDFEPVEIQDESELDPPRKRGISLKGALK